MKCCVPKCKNGYKKDDNKNLGYHTFPKDKKLRKKWLQFCNMQEKELILSPNKVVCTEHFTPDCLEGYLKFEMGFCSKRFLRADAIPTIRFPKEGIRSKRLDKRNNKKLVDTLIKEYTAKIESECAAAAKATEFVGVEDEIVQYEEIDTKIDENNDLIIQDDEICKEEKNEEVNSFEEKIKKLEKENKILQHEYSLLEERSLSMERRYQYEINELKDKLEMTEREKENLENNLNALQQGVIIWP